MVEDLEDIRLSRDESHDVIRSFIAINQALSILEDARDPHGVSDAVLDDPIQALKKARQFAVRMASLYNPEGEHEGPTPPAEQKARS